MKVLNSYQNLLYLKVTLESIILFPACFALLLHWTCFHSDVILFCFLSHSFRSFYHVEEKRCKNSGTRTRNCPFKGRKFKASETVQWMHDLIWEDGP